MTRRKYFTTPKKPLTIDQLRALENSLLISRELSSEVAKLFVWLLRQSQGLTRNVYVFVPADFLSLDKINQQISKLNSRRSSTLQEILQVIGTDKVFEFKASWSACGNGFDLWFFTTEHRFFATNHTRWATRLDLDRQAIKNITRQLRQERSLT